MAACELIAVRADSRQAHALEMMVAGRMRAIGPHNRRSLVILQDQIEKQGQKTKCCQKTEGFRFGAGGHFRRAFFSESLPSLTSARPFSSNATPFFGLGRFGIGVAIVACA